MIRKMEISCSVEVVVIGLCKGLWGEEFSLLSLKGMLNFWKDSRLKRERSHVMVTFKGRFKGEIGEK